MMRSFWLSIFLTITFFSLTAWSKRPSSHRAHVIRIGLKSKLSKTDKKHAVNRWARRTERRMAKRGLYPQCVTYYSEQNRDSFINDDDELSAALLAPMDPSEEELQDFQKIGWAVQEGVGYVKRKAFPITLVQMKPYGGYLLEIRTARAFHKMALAAKKKKISLFLKSGFREMEKQEELFRNYCFQRNSPEAAVPGTSMHQAGYAIDLNVKEPGVKRWMQLHAKEYGFFRTVPSEDWHYEFSPTGDPLPMGGRGMHPKKSRRGSKLYVAKAGRSRHSHMNKSV